MKLLLPGGSGHVGVVLARAFHAEGHEVVVLSRRPGSAPWRVRAWDGRTMGPWVDELDTTDVVINLAIAWERVFDEASAPGTRKVAMRSAA